MHIEIDATLCDGCGNCVGDCPTDAMYMRNGQAHVDTTLCTVCGSCLPSCHVKAISLEDDPE